MKVTAFIKYDLYPYYIVLDGDLQENFDVKSSCVTYNRSKVLDIKPFSELEMHKNNHTTIRKEHDRRLRKIKVDLLKEHGINFINTEHF